jgi:hypothetical protein
MSISSQKSNSPKVFVVQIRNQRLLRVPPVSKEGQQSLSRKRMPRSDVTFTWRVGTGTRRQPTNFRDPIRLVVGLEDDTRVVVQVEEMNSWSNRWHWEWEAWT